MYSYFSFSVDNFHSVLSDIGARPKPQMQHICSDRNGPIKIANGIAYIPMGYENRKWYDNKKSIAVIVTSIPKSQMDIMWSICDYRVRVYLP